MTELLLESPENDRNCDSIASCPGYNFVDQNYFLPFSLRESVDFAELRRALLVEGLRGFTSGGVTDDVFPLLRRGSAFHSFPLLCCASRPAVTSVLRN